MWCLKIGVFKNWRMGVVYEKLHDPFKLNLMTLYRTFRLECEVYQ